MAMEDDIEEKQTKEAERLASKEKYLKEQAEKQQKWLEEHPEEAAKMKAQGQIPGHGHGHGHSHGGGGHSHGPAPSLGGCCGFATPEQIEHFKQKAQQPQIPIEEKNAKIVRAAEATREHGNQLYKEGKYEEAFMVYERGCHIITGAIHLDDEQQTKMSALEVVLDVNMAMCRLKQNKPLQCLDLCEMALHIDPDYMKAHYRRGEAFVAMKEYEKAHEAFMKAAKLEPQNTTIRQQLAKVKQLQADEREKQRQFDAAMKEKLAARLHKE